MAKSKEKVQFKELSITSWDSGEGVDISTGCIQFKYYESILSNHVTASMVLGETGNTVGEGKQKKNLLDGLPVRGGEPVRFRVIDPNDNEIKFVGENAFYVNTVRDVLQDTSKTIATFDLCTKEFLANEQTRVVKRYSGKISENVKKILRDVLQTKNFNARDIEETANSYNFIGNVKKPFYTLTWLASKCIPADGAYGATAGFLFFETQDGFQFKSIDTLVGPTKGGGSADSKGAKKFEYTDTDKRQPGFGKIIQYNLNQNINLQEKLTIGAYNSRFLFFNPFTFEVKYSDFAMDKEQKTKVKKSGEQLDFVAEEFRQGPTRGLSAILDVGTLPTGFDGLKQLAQWKLKPEETNDRVKERMVQSITRYNQLCCISVDIMIEADFSLRAGDTIYCQFPDLSAKTSTHNKETSGNYLIASMCHKITPDRSFTTLNLIRDSFGKPEGRPEGFARVLAGVADHMTGNFFDFDKRGGWLGPNSRI